MVYYSYDFGTHPATVHRRAAARERAAHGDRHLRRPRLLGTNTTEVAKQAGISQAYVYRLFPNKEALFVAVVEHCFARVRGCLKQAMAEADGAAAPAVLAAMGEAYAKLIVDKDLVLLQLTRRPRPSPSPRCARPCSRVRPRRRVRARGLWW